MPLPCGLMSMLPERWRSRNSMRYHKLLRHIKRNSFRSVWPVKPFVISRKTAIQERLVGSPSKKDRELTGDPNERKPKLFSHDNTWKWLASVANNSNIKVLEIGSREVASASFWKKFIPLAHYTGFDYLPGENVDITGDAHKLSNYFPKCEFDIVISLAVFEHLAMPWIVAEEIAKILKIGGLVCIETHFSFGEHEMPWNFFQFNSEGLKVLFNSRLGFEVLDSGMSNPVVGRFSADASDYLVGKPISGMYCHSSIIAKKIVHVMGEQGPSFDWRGLIDLITLGSSYPAETGLSKRPDESAGA